MTMAVAKRVAIGLSVLCALGVTGPGSARDPQALPTVVDRAPEIRITGDSVTLPLVMIGEFPFIEASIAGVRGKLMLDTGIEAALTLNDHRVPTVGAMGAAERVSGSGMTFAASLVPEVREIGIGSLRFPSATFVDSQDARALEGITPDFIGWLGYRAFANRALELDYRRSRVTFRRVDDLGFLRKERVIVRLPFETRRLPNHPIIPGLIGTLAVTTTWDTGQNGALYVDARTRARLVEEGRLRPSPSRRGAYDLDGLRLGGRRMPVLRAIDVEAPPSRAGTAIGIVEPVQLSIGYGLLRHFRTVWDNHGRAIYLLAD